MPRAARALAATAVALALAACSGAPASSGPSPAGSGDFGALAFVDEFDGDTVDGSRWIVPDAHVDEWPETPWRRNWKRDNVRIEDGALVIDIVAEPDGSFSTGAVQTGDWGRTTRFEQAFGRWEARIRFPSTRGHWSAFWLFTETQGRIGDGGRDGSEIDIVEKAWLADRVEHNLHWDGYGADSGSAGQPVEGLGVDDGDWHTYRLDWTPDEYAFFVDGVETWRTDAGGVAQTPNYLIISVEIGNYGDGPYAWGGGPIDAADMPDRLEVDYVRVWEYVGTPPGP